MASRDDDGTTSDAASSQVSDGIVDAVKWIGDEGYVRQFGLGKFDHGGQVGDRSGHDGGQRCFGWQ